jgi:hypothetical protein
MTDPFKRSFLAATQASYVGRILMATRGQTNTDGGKGQ